jgi:cytochrome c-type biogenesis protein CcmH
MSRIGIALAALLLASPGYAIDASEEFDDPVLQARYEAIIAEVRCMQCQNESLRDSEAFLAVDLRREIRRLLSEGKTDAEVYEFVVSRYGEFALYRPRMSGKTLVLWIAPLLLLVVGATIVLKVVRGRMALPLDEP